jgi:GTPase SAR1 family protein
MELRLRLTIYEVVGMQSDGKSSFVEALLGFQFNTIETRKVYSLHAYSLRNWN